MANPILDPEGYENESRSSSPVELTRSFDVVELPSRGKLYKNQLKDKTHIEVYYLTAKEEDILTSSNMLSSGKMFDYLIKSVLVDKSIDPSQLLLGDRNTILTWLRSTGYGSDYPVEVKCSYCNNRFVNEFDLSKLEMRYLDIDPDEDGLFEITLPVSKRRVRVSFLTAGEAALIEERISTRSKKLGGSGNPMTEKLMSYIKEIDGISNQDKKSFIERMPVKDSREIRRWINEHDPDLIMKQDVKCVKCGELNEEVTIPITVNFFWPDA